ncbi:hypothetical protein PTUN_b0170 [Pseudoalteromonas tunicata]|nr:hypothetical protein PTUN_b0170 [Pseudoalteromonas tunicata]
MRSIKRKLTSQNTEINRGKRSNAAKSDLPAHWIKRKYLSYLSLARDSHGEQARLAR